MLHSFTGQPDGNGPDANPIYVDGAFYGTTESGGANGFGSIFKIGPAGNESVVYSCKGGATDGADPGALLLNVGGTLYGTTAGGRLAGCKNDGACGTVFSVTQAGVETVLHLFQFTDGRYPFSGLARLGHKIYGTTYQYGAGIGGTVFSISR